MDPPNTHCPEKVEKDNMEAPPLLPCRFNWKQQVKRNPLITTPGVSELMDEAAIDTDSEYEYVANPMKKHDISTLHTFNGAVIKAGHSSQFKENNAEDEGDSWEINVDNVHDQEVPKGRELNKEMKGRISEIRPQHAMHCSHKDENSDGYQKLIKETMEHAPDYQQLYTGTIVPS